jgi:hypothetical protein
MYKYDLVMDDESWKILKNTVRGVEYSKKLFPIGEELELKLDWYKSLLLMKERYDKINKIKTKINNYGLGK